MYLIKNRLKEKRMVSYRGSLANRRNLVTGFTNLLIVVGHHPKQGTSLG